MRLRVQDEGRSESRDTGGCAGGVWGRIYGRYPLISLAEAMAHSSEGRRSCIHACMHTYVLPAVAARTCTHARMHTRILLREEEVAALGAVPHRAAHRHLLRHGLDDCVRRGVAKAIGRYLGR